MDDWTSPAFVAHYNGVYGMGPEEARAALEPLALSPGDRFVDFGCGGGGFVAAAAAKASLAVGMDSSPEQLKLARAALAGTANARLVDAGFLSFAWGEAPFTKAFSRKALHHLTDDEKGVFFERAAGMLAPGALFLIEDAVFDFDRSELGARMAAVLAEAEAYYGAGWAAKKDDFQRCLAAEHPTGFPQWERALRRGGFAVARRVKQTCFYGSILAQRGP